MRLHILFFGGDRDMHIAMVKLDWSIVNWGMVKICFFFLEN